MSGTTSDRRPIRPFPSQALEHHQRKELDMGTLIGLLLAVVGMELMIEFEWWRQNRNG